MQKLFLLFGLICFFGSCNLSAMDTKQDVTENKKIKPWLLRELPYPESVKNFGKQIKIVGGKNQEKNNSYKEYINILKKCPEKTKKFVELIKAASKQKKPFILAVITKNEDKKERPYRSYYDASSLYIRLNKEALKPIYFFSINSLDDDFRYIGDEETCSEIIFVNESNKKIYTEFVDNCCTIVSDLANNLGVRYYEQKKFELSECCLKKAINLGSVTALDNLGYLYMCLGNYELAENYLEQAIEKKYLYSYYNLGMLYLKMDNLELAWKNLKIAADNGEKEAKDELLKLDKKIVDII